MQLIPNDSSLRDLYDGVQNYVAPLPRPILSPTPRHTKTYSLLAVPSFPLTLRHVGIALLTLIVTLLGHYAVTWRRYHAQHRSREAIKVPPTVPYWIPGLGSAIEFAFTAKRFVESSTWRLGAPAPFGVKVGDQTYYFVAGSQNIQELWKKAGTIPSPLWAFCMENLFNMPKHCLEMFVKDDSGILAKPRPGSNVAPHNRVDFRSHTVFANFMAGEGISHVYNRWKDAFQNRLEALNLDENWRDESDFTTFWVDVFGDALIEAFVGRTLLSVNPSLTRDLLEYDRSVPDLSRLLPRWIIPKAYAIRDKVYKTVEQWHQISRSLLKDFDGVDLDAEPERYWDLRFIRERQRVYDQVDDYDGACPGSDMGFVWGALSNIYPAITWEMFYIFQDPSLTARVRAEFEATFPAPELTTATYNVDSFNAQHLLQSVCAETLRRHVSAYIMRSTHDADLHLGPWRFPARSSLFVCTTSGHMDPTFWNHQNNKYPVTSFWPERFLVDAADPTSGPWKDRAHTDQKGGDPTDLTKAAAERGAPTFTTAGTQGHYFPFGGGPRACPGRFLTKRAMVAAAAIMTTRYEIEFGVKEGDPALTPNPKSFGLGNQLPTGKVPFRIRKRWGAPGV